MVADMDRVEPLIAGWKWPILAVFAALAMLAAAHAFERFAHLPPCPLCLRQREVYWALIAMVPVGVALWTWRPTRRFLVALNVLVGLVFLTGAGVAFYHMGAEYGWWLPPAGCSALMSPQEAARLALESDLLGELGQRQAVADCGAAPWSFLGLSMAGWNMLASLVLAGLSFLAARATIRQPA